MSAPVAEFIDLGPCPECGTPRQQAVMCTCGHEAFLHDLGTRKGTTVRTACSNTNGKTGPCPCRMFEEAPQ
jgi:hypothetical protein